MQGAIRPPNGLSRYISLLFRDFLKAWYRELRLHSVQIIGCDKRWEVTPLRCYQVLMTCFFRGPVYIALFTAFCVSPRLSTSSVGDVLDQEFV